MSDVEVSSATTGETPAKRTPLYEEHCRLKAKMIPFGGWAMPVDYGSILAEHSATRTAAGLFDLSHMGEVIISGPRALELVQALVTNDAATLVPGQALYSPMCRDNGTIVDDVVVYRLPELPAGVTGGIMALLYGDGHKDGLAATSQPIYLIVVNASTTDKDLAWIEEVAQRRSLRESVVVHNRSPEIALIAVQGPRAMALLGQATDDLPAVVALPHFSTALMPVVGTLALVSRTGYTGEDGFEIYLPAAQSPAVWRWFLDHGQDDGLRPCGLGARDTLRLEARLPLYGNDIDDTTTPLEAGLGWTVKLDTSPQCIGHDALAAQKATGVPRLLAGMTLEGRAVPRHGYRVLDATGQQAIGTLTSGAYSPTLGHGIALGYLRPDQARPGTIVQVDIRGRGQLHPARIVRGPFYKRQDHP